MTCSYWRRNTSCRQETLRTSFQLESHRIRSLQLKIRKYLSKNKSSLPQVEGTELKAKKGEKRMKRKKNLSIESTLNVFSKSNQMLKQKEEEFKINFDLYNSKRLHQPLMYESNQKMRMTYNENTRNLFKGFHDEKLLITNTMSKNSPKFKADLNNLEITGSLCEPKDNEPKETHEFDERVEDLRDSSKFQSRSLVDIASLLPSKPEFPTRFCAKPFVHYGNSVKIATIKKKEIDRVVYENDNKMKLYVALLQKKKNSEKPTIEEIKNEMRSPKINKLSSSIERDLYQINIEKRENMNNQSNEESPSKAVIIMSNAHELSSEDALPSINTKSLVPYKSVSDSIAMQHQSIIPEMSIINKSILEKNEERVPKYKIITSIRKFDDRVINFPRAHRSLVDLTCGYMAKSKLETSNYREKILRQDYIEIPNITKEMMFNYSVDPYSGEN